MNPRLPRDSDGMNDARAEWATTAVDAFIRETGVDDEAAVADLLADLMHLADRKGTSFARDLAVAMVNYVAETEGTGKQSDAISITGDV